MLKYDNCQMKFVDSVVDGDIWIMDIRFVSIVQWQSF